MFNKLNFKDRITLRFWLNSVLLLSLVMIFAIILYFSEANFNDIINSLIIVGILTILMIVLDYYVSRWVYRGIIVSLKDVYDYIKKVSSSIGKSNTAYENLVNKQLSLISDTEELLKHLSVKSEETKHSAQRVADKSNKALQMSEQGQQSMYVNIKNMSTLKQKIETIAEQILELSEHTQQIGSIVGVVEDITEQTNMLALNAAVEAARAGEHGRGFAVVASEIRKLADQIKQATTKITSLIYDIQQATNSTVMATEEGTKEIEAGVNLANQASETINALHSTMQETVEAIETILHVSREQFKCANEVSNVMSSVNHGINETIDTVEKSRNAIIVLDKVSGSISEICMTDNHKKIQLD